MSKNDNIIITRSKSKKRDLESTFDNSNIEKVSNISNIVLSAIFDNIINNLYKKIKIYKDDELDVDLDSNFDVDSVDSEEELIDPTYDPNLEEFDDIEKLKNKEDNNDKESKKFLESNIFFKETIFNNYSNDEKIYFNTLDLSKKEIIMNTEMKILDENEEKEPYRFKILNLDIDIYTKNIILKKIKQLDNYSIGSDYAKYKLWINNFFLLPINKYNNLPVFLNDSNEDKINYLKNSKDILDKSIYGHKQPKDNILRILAQWINNPEAFGNCIALQGPMGNGKTTLVRNGICKAMNRPFGFISLGGCTDSSYLLGHDFTYEGSIYGKIAQILIECKCMNPIIYFDELDKVSEDVRGKEIINTLIHITDNSQNNTFEDKYFSEIKLDLSKVLFIFSYNNEELIDPILRDRLNIIKTQGYNIDDKVKICHDFLIPDQINKMGLSKDDIIFDDDILKYIITKYTKEEGVRNLKRCIEKIISKINLLILLKNDKNINIDIDIDYKLDNIIDKPYKLTIKNIEKLLTLDNINNDNISVQMMYL